MTDIRPIRREEGDAFLHLLCDSFDLDFQRAKSVFFREPMFDYQRKWALFQAGRMCSILTTVPLLFGWGNAIGIAGVATRSDCRGVGLASALLSEVLRLSEKEGEGHALLFARDRSLYKRSGFRVLDQVVRAPLSGMIELPSDQILEFDQVEALYNSWAASDPNRLRRDERRWSYWKWNFRVCSSFGSGYLCNEGGLVRECITDVAANPWPVDTNTEWLGLVSMAEHLQAPITDPEFEHFLMGYNFESVPQFFMTDQF